MELSMKEKISNETTMSVTPRHLGLFLAAGLLTLACLPASAWGWGDRAGEYRQTNLVGDLPGVALLQDTNLVNAWGISFSATSPFWISDNGSGQATVYAVKYDTNGTVSVTKQGAHPTIPGNGTPSGQLFNGTGAFNGDIFIFSSEDGTISGWRGALGGAAEVLVTRTNAGYKGITLITTSNGPVLLAANFREGSVDAYGTNLMLMAQYQDPKAPKGYAPFNVQLLDGMVFVTYAKQDAAKHDDDSGPGRGLIDVFDPATLMFHRLATGKA